MQTPRNGMLDKSDTYTLYLSVAVPESSGLPMSALNSPKATFGRYEGYCFDEEAPHWTGMRPGLPLLFRQPRGAMAELFHGLAIWAENLEVVGDISHCPFQSDWILITSHSLTCPGKCSIGPDWWQYVFYPSLRIKQSPHNS
jgi:hypothetical protein